MVSIIFNTFIASLIPLSFGYFLNKFLFKNKNISLFEFGIYGFLPIGIIALLLNFFYPLSQNLNNLFLIPIFFFMLELFKEGKIYSFLKINFLISILVIIFIAFDTVYRPDAGWYHLPFTKILNDFKIIFGTASLHPMFGVNSILQYISAAFNNSILSDKGVLIIDDYGHWEGAKKAVDEYFSSQDYKPLFNVIDRTGRSAIKTGNL